MEQPAITSAFEHAPTHVHAYEAVLHRGAAVPRIGGGAPSPPAGAVERARRLQRAEAEHTNRMMVAIGLYLVGGAILSSVGLVSVAYFAVAMVLIAWGAVIQQKARRKLRAVLIEHSMAEGLSAAAAKARAEAVIEGEAARE